MAEAVAPMSRHRARTWAPVVLALAAIGVVSVDAPLNATVHGMPAGLAFAVALVRAAALVAAWYLPLGAAVGSTASAVLFASTAAAEPGAPWPWSVTGLIAAAATAGVLAIRGHWLVAASGLAASVVATVAVVALVPGGDDEAASVNIIVALSVSAGVLALAAIGERWWRTRRQLAEANVVTAQEHAARVIAEEKARIARELHDVIAHSMSLINVQALSAPARHPGTPPQLRAEFEEIAAASRRALGEMRELLAVLRGGDEAPRAPLAHAGDIPRLVEQAASAGADVSFEGSAGAPEDLPEVVSLALYRIAQEGVSNALRHAPGAPVRIALTSDDDVVRLSIVNGAAPAPGPRETGGGSGLEGVRERVARLGGVVFAGRLPDGGFELTASIPRSSVHQRSAT